MVLETPLLLIAWRRPHTVRQVITAIRPVAPSRLFVACDGPSPDRPEEAEKVVATRAVIEAEIDWPCEIAHLYADTNQGCRLGVSRAINWFFEQVEEGIILEDDCVPHPDFFPYCSELLERYRYDPRVWCISGDNSGQIAFETPYSYAFIRNPLVWGWASWRRSWEKYEASLSTFAKSLNDPVALKDLFPSTQERIFRVDQYNSFIKSGTPDSWAIPMTWSAILNRQLSIIPKVNLVRNIGFDADACHTIKSNRRSHVETQSILPLCHPPFPYLDRVCDTQVLRRIHGINRRTLIKRSVKAVAMRLVRDFNQIAKQ